MHYCVQKSSYIYYTSTMDTRDRSQVLHSNPNHHGTNVVYVMGRDQRVRDNHALCLAQQAALHKQLPLVVLFVLRTIANRSREHYDFMLGGLEEVSQTLGQLHITFVMRQGAGAQPIMQLLQETNADSVFFDFSPLVGPRQVAATVAQDFAGTTTVVDTHNIIPVWVTSSTQEFAAHTIRRKVHRLLPSYLQEQPQTTVHPHVLKQTLASLSFADARQAAASLPACGISTTAQPGEAAAQMRLADFIATTLPTYASERNNIANDRQSGLSPYLHFGQLASLRVALHVLQHTNTTPLLFSQPRMAQAAGIPSAADGMNALFEEMIVRKELSDNFCYYQPRYKSLDGTPAWARTTLQEHVGDPRSYTYTRDQWEAAATHDPAWNAAQRQLLHTGKIHGYMRMYWAKKMLEWSQTPQQAIADCIYLNDKYSIDGGDPNGYAGILWSMAGLHDRPWTERPVFGKIRYMNAAGLQRKFDVAAYIAQWS